MFISYKTLDFFWEKLFNYNKNILQKKYHVLSNEGVNEEVNLLPTNGQDFNDKRPTNSYKFNRQLKFAFGCTVNWQRTRLSFIFYETRF